jgi:uncharacterized protein involved in outer membrane biogenesis
MRATRKILVSAVMAVLLMVAAGAVLISTVDLNEYVSLVEAKAKEATGRELKLRGKVGYKLSLFPTVAADDVSFQNAPWGSRAQMASAKRVEIQIALLPLLTGDIVVRRVLLVQPEVLLEVNAKGEKNWVFAGSAKTQGATEDSAGGGRVDVRRIEIEDGLLSYREAKPRLEHRAKIDRLRLDAENAFDEVAFDGKGTLNDVPLVLKGQVDNLHHAGETGATGAVELEADLGGNQVALDGRLPLAGGAPDGLDARFDATLKDVAALRKMLRRPFPALPATQLKGHASMQKAALVVEDLQATIGKSRARGSLRLGLEGERRPFELRLDAPLIDLPELYALRKAVGGDAPAKRGDGRVFPNDPFPLAALKALDGDAEIKIAKLRLDERNELDELRMRTRFDQGKIDSDELKLRLQGGELSVEVHGDAASGKSLALEATLTGQKVPLAALFSLAGVSPPPEGAPTDVAIQFSGRGNSVRGLMASASGNVRVVVGPGRIKNRALDVGADVTQLLNSLNPARGQDPYTEMKCAVLRFPVRNGIATISNGIALETSKVRLLGGGTVNLRNETLELAFRPEAASGLGVGAGNLARYAKVEGTLANPRIGIDMAGAASTAAVAGAAIATGGLTLLAGGLLIDNVPDNPCQVALSGVAPKQESTVDKVLNPIKKLFGN